MGSITKKEQENASGYWDLYLAGMEPCKFPRFENEPFDQRRPLSVDMTLKHKQELQYLLQQDPIMIHCAVSTAWGLVLRCYTGLEDVCFGYQEAAEADSLMGISTTRIAFEENKSLADLIEKSRADYYRGLKHQQPVRADASEPSEVMKNQLFNTAVLVQKDLNVQIRHGDSIALRPLAAASFEENSLYLVVRLSKCGLDISLHWWSSEMSTEHALNVCSQFDKMLSDIVNCPNITIKELDYFSERNKQQVQKWNSAPLDEVKRCVHEVISDQVLSRANADAICSEDGTLSYNELDELSSRLAQYLVSLGVRPEVFVPLCFDKGLWNVVSMIAVLKAGGAFVPLDPAAPITRLQSLTKSVGGNVLLCSQQHVGILGDVTETIIPIDREAIASLPVPDSDNQLPSVDSTNAAYIIFTSGTTGEPKGTIIEHGAYCSGAKAHGPAQLMTPESRVLQFAAHTWDASIVEMLTTLMVGGAVCIPTENQRLNNVVSAIEEMRVNWAVLTPSFVGFINPVDVPELKTLVLAGEAMSKSNIETWSKINLVNGYGPSECSVAAVVNSQVTTETSPTNIGKGAGVHLWVVDPFDHDRLVPVGCVGELLVQGPTLARGYHNNPEKTAESFIQKPLWSRNFGAAGRNWPIYKTGDLVRQNPDGTFNFIGRKDNQVKVHGQRVELGEIEHHLNMDSNVTHALALLPKSGPFKQRLISVLSMSQIQASDEEEGSILQISNDSAKESALVRERLSTRLPVYMVPSAWLIVERIPLLTSGKLDRKRVSTWVENMSEELYRRVIEIAEPIHQDMDDSKTPATEVESKLRAIWSHVLNLRLDQVDLNRSFMSLGGDSISAMQVKGQCARKDISLTVQEILRSKSIKQLAQCAKAVDHPSHHTEIVEQDFSLSPIQRLFFLLPNQGRGHFNQSFFLRITRRIQKKALRAAIETIINRHSMLRARFRQVNAGAWQQRITEEVATSYRLKAYNIDTLEQATAAIANSQTSLDIVKGPVFAVDLFDVNGDDQLLFMVGHHTVIDLVSWRVILEDVEELLVDPSVCSMERPPSFQTWCQMQAEHCQKFPTGKVLPVQDVPASDAEYWKMETPNTYGEVTCEGFEIDFSTTSAITTCCHDALRTETVDILLSALIHSFAQAFPDRAVPAIYNEGHGREPSGMAIDVSRTVGWFTIMYPVFVPDSASKDLVETVRHVKDLRRMVPDNGRPYFASRCLTQEGRERFSKHWPLEVTFNYLGQYQQLEREGALLRPVEDMAGEARAAGGTADVGHETPRFGLFEISAVIVQGKLRFSFTFNQHMSHRDKILQWVSGCQKTISLMAERLSKMIPEATLGDFPLLSLDYDRLNVMATERFPQIGITSIEDVEAVYPSSSMQEGLLISQTKDSAFYAVQVMYELQARNVPKDARRLANAWQRVVDRHAALRTVFIESVSSDEGLFDQVVLKSFIANVTYLDCDNESDMLRALAERNAVDYNDASQPPHRFTVGQTSNGKVFCKLEISHTIMDGGSMSVIFKDIALAYEGLLRDEPGFQYSDYIAYLQEQPSVVSIDYWKSYLTNVEPCNFPVLNDGVSVKNELRSLRLNFEDSRFAELQRFCDENGVTFSNVLHTAWGLTLRCYTNSDDTCFGYLTSGRDAPLPGIEDAVGPFINMLVCRVSMVPASRLGAVLDQIQKDYIDSLPHRSASLAEVQHALRLSGTALFNTSLSYRRLPTERKSEQPQVSFEECMPGYDPTEYSLSVNIEASDDHAAIDLDYWTDWISDGQAANVGDTFLQALQNIVHHSGQMIEQLSQISSSHHEQILDWNSKIPEVIDDCVHRVIAKQVASQPDAPAVSSWDAAFTYAELDELSTRLAHYLVELNVGPEMFVPTCFDKSAYTIVAMLAVLKAGAAAVPLDATHPRAPLELRVRDVQAQVVLAAPSRAQMFCDMVPNVVTVDREFLSQLPAINHEACPSVMPMNPCFIIFTSGSTGKPKGVVLEHRAIVTSGRATGDAYSFGPTSRVLQFAAYTFDNSLEEIFITLMRGGCVCVPSEHDRFNNLAEAINKLEVNFMDITPTVAGFLRPSDVPKLKGLSLGGEPLTKENIEVWGKDVELHCCYGPSECSINSTWNGDLGRSSEATNIGKCIGSVSWVVDPSNHDRLTPIGCVGELLIEGPILARGYLNDHEKTSKAFITSPAWASGDKRRMYKTGDLVRYNSDGTITYLGRKDTQVKLNGQRIELGEIEHHVKSNLSSEIQSAVELITLNDNKNAKKSLAAFLCLQSDGSVPSATSDDFVLPMSDSLRSTATTLEACITSSLPAYMVPTVYIPVLAMPMTSSGKLDRRRLRTTCHALSEEQASTYRLARKTGRAPSTNMEKSLSKLWESILKIEANSVGADDNFFRLGGDSIGAMRLITAARSEGISLTVATIFQQPILSDLASHAVLAGSADHESTTQIDIKPFTLLEEAVDIQKLKDEVASFCQVTVDSIQDIYPCTSIQEGLIALSNKSPGAYVAQNLYRLPQDIDLDRFREAWQRVVEAEHILRTRIVYTKSLGFVQVVVQERITWHTATNLHEIVEENRELPAHNGGILSSYTIVEESGNNPKFIWTSHHALYDGWCIPLMLERVEKCYRELESVDPIIGAAYPRFIKYLSGIDAAESDDFWRTKLSESNAVQFPHLPHPAYQVHATSIASHIAPISREAGSTITLPSIVRAAWALVVSVYSGSAEEVLFGETLTGRDAPVQDIADIIGPTLATIPTRIRINSQLTAARFLEDVQSQLAEATPFQFAGLQHIKHLSEDTAMACGFQNLLAINHDDQESSTGFWDLQSSGTVGTNFYSYPLTVSCQLCEGKVEIDVHYDQDVISTWLVGKMLHQFEFFIQRLNSTDTNIERIGEMILLNPNDQHTLQNWNSGPLKVVNKCIHRLVEKQTLEQPESTIAVDSWDAILTYRKLHELSNRLAQHLLAQGATGTLVPLCFEKSAWTIVAMLSVLKSGSAFVPLDPAAPVARLRDIVVDTDATIILCSPRYRRLCESIATHAISVDCQTIYKFPIRQGVLPSCDSNSPAYVIFTSGTTGKPKGTIVQHAAFCSGAAAHGPALRMQSTSRVLQFASYVFDASLLEIFTTLILGGTVCVPNDEARLNNITGVINDMNISWTLLTPSFIQLVQPSEIPDLRTLVLGGEAMSQSHLHTWADKLELINAYGPSECAVVATVNPQITLSTDPTNMGRAVGGRAWIVDPNNHHRLSPVGSIGELAIEGPILAQGYLKNDSKTAEVFIENPKWALMSGASNNLQKRRIYKTGDLVKYTTDGRMIFCGRKDTQVKLHGQRLELGEVEYHLRTDPAVQHVLAAIPTTGHCKKRLVAVLSLQELSTSNHAAGGLKVVVREACEFYLSGIRERLCEHLPAYMIPSNWVVLQKLPLLPSGKLDRRQIEKWIENMSADIYHQISDTEIEKCNPDATSVERQLQVIWGNALNLPPDQIGLQQPFLHLGGDSISAMQVMSRCRADGLGVTVQDIIQSKSISQLALRVTLPEQVSYEEEAVDQIFDLSPMQALYFDCVGDKWAHFNQSVLVRLANKTSPEELAFAIDTIVKSHSMLRARFGKSDAGIWKQRVIPDVSASYRYNVRTVSTDSIQSLVEDSQRSLDIQAGPTFAVDLLNMNEDDHQLVLFVAHHLIIDVVSWRIILQDLEDILESGNIKMQSSLTFQTWSRLQADHARQIGSKDMLYLDDVPVADLSYWEMTAKSNVYGDTVENGFEIDEEVTLQLLGNCNDALQTDPVDLFIAAVIQSFRKVFPDRSTAPAIYNEGHGREPWSSSKIDISRTVGWFTTMCPIYLPSAIEGKEDSLNSIRWVKDLRKRIPDKARPYFAHRLLTEEGKERFAGHWPMEVTFNYLGKLQQLERKDALVQQVERSVNAEFDIGADVPRFALFEISAVVENGSIKFSFSYNRHMKRQAKIRRWVVECERSLRDAANRLLTLRPERTLSDFPLLPLTYNGMEKLIEKLPQLGVSSLDQVEDVYPSSPIQQGMLLAQLKNPDLYAYAAIFEARSTDSNEKVDSRMLVESWQDTVRRHSTLRTIFIDSVCQEGRTDQVVLKDKIARVAWLECEESKAIVTLSNQNPVNFRDLQPPHRFTLCKTDMGRVFCKLEISHAISDGTSIPILLGDLSRAYCKRLELNKHEVFPTNGTMERERAVSRLPTSIAAPLYSEYISHLQSIPPDEDINYWKTYLAGIEPCHLTALNDGEKSDKKLQSLVLSLIQSSELRSFCNKNGVTLSNVLQLVWSLTLRSYTGSDDVCFGYLTSGRDAPVTGLQDAAVGAFINMLTCRMNLSETLPISKALEQIQSDFVHGMAHQTCSLADVQHELQLSGASLFNTAFTFQKRSASKPLAESTLSFETMSAHDPSEYDVTVNVEALDSGVEVHFGYWTTSLSTAQANNVSKTFEHMVNSLISQSQLSQSIGELDFFSEHSRQQVMDWNCSLPKTIDSCIHEIVHEQRLSKPISTPAVCAWDRNLTYTELEELSGRLAIYLTQHGVGPEVYVPLCFEKTAWAVVSMIAVLKAGGAFVPLDYSHPPSRLKHFIDDVQADLVLCSEQNQEKVSGAVKETFVVSEDTMSKLDRYSDLSLLPTVATDSAAYIIFTSGTTGRPKGTIVEHAAFCTSAIEHSKAMNMDATSRVLQFASYTFDASVMEILSTLVVGGCVCIPSSEERMNDIPGAIQRMDVNWTLLTPSVASTLSPKSVPSLRVLVTGGEAMSSGHIAKWRGSCSLVNAYGPSETSVIASTSTKVDIHGTELNTDSSNIGRGVGGRTWIIDPRNYNKLVPVGAVGELVVEGRIVARGYLNNEQKTTEAFIKNPTWLSTFEQRERVYRTGDLVRYNSDGTLCFLARKDTQIKLNGQRIELGEIEHNVKVFLPEDSQSAVELVAPMSRIATKALAVFFCLPSNTFNSVPEDDRVSGVDEILLSMSDTARTIAKNLDSSLAGVLPTYMIPSFYVPVNRMPWTSSGKLDRARLRAIIQALPKELTGPYRLASSKSKQAAKPATPMEQKLQQLWSVVLNIETPGSIGVEDSFFRLGGDSITAMRLVGAAKAEKISMTVIDIFRNPRLSDMALICGTVEEEKQSELEAFSLIKGEESVDRVVDELVEQCAVDRVQVKDAYPCSLLQEGLITLSIKQAGAYTLTNVFRLPADVDMERFKNIWEKTVEEVDILRTRIVHLKSSSFLQVLLREDPINWQSARTLEELEAEEVQLPAHNGGPLTRYTIIDGNDSDGRYFVWSVHHCLYDGWSLPMVLKRVETAYLDSTSNFPASPYVLFIKYLSDIDEQASDEFWRTRLSGAAPLQFPQNQSLESDQGHSTQMVTHTATISRHTAGMGITVPTIIRAAWGILVSAYSGSNDVVFGETLAGRDIPINGITDIIGPVFTTVPTRIQVDCGESVTQFLQTIQNAATEVIPYQHAGLQRIKRLDADTEVACDFQNLLVIQTAEEEVENGLWDLQGSGVAANFFTYPLVLECKGGSDKIDIHAHYDENVLSTWQVQRLLFQLDHILKQLSNFTRLGNNVKLGAVDIFSPQDKELVQKWNSIEPELIDTCIHEEFEEMVLSQPLAPAVSSWDGEMTYEELRDHSTWLAHHLVGLGVGPEVFVPICMDKSKWVIVAMLGVLMAGGGFVPLDPASPISRHQEMIQDVKANSILCSPKYTDRYISLVQNTIPVDERLLNNLQSRDGHKHDLHRSTSRNAAYIIFTSGSTGRPKGTLIEHRAISSSSIAMRTTLLMKPCSRVFQFASFTFDVSILETLTTLTMGGCICLPSEDLRTRNVAEAINSLNATWAFLTPSVANLIEPANVPSLEVLVCGGEAMSIENVLKWADKVTLVNGYGPTEASVIAVANQTVSEQKDPSNIGYALSSGHAWIADPIDHHQITPVGCVGELLLDGHLLAREYINNPSKTAEAFVDRPRWAAAFDEAMSPSKTSTKPSSNAPSRMYKTGDLVKYSEDGSFIFIGRKDNQVKLHGQRMELGEIEHSLDKDSQVQHALVALPKSGPFRKRLVAVLSLSELSTTALSKNACELVLDGPRAATARGQVAKVRSRLADCLPSYMVPLSWLVVEAIPLLASGKLDRRNVDAWLQNIDDATYERIIEAEEEDDNTNEATETTKILQQIFSRVLNLPMQRVKLSHSFLSLGGDSITAMQVMALCRRERMNFSLSEVLRCKSIHQLALNARFEDEVQHQEEKLDQAFDLSPVQQLYFESQPSATYEGDARFNQSFSLEITRHVDAEEIQRALDNIVKNHSMLRARFSKAKSGTWQQRIIQDTKDTYSYRIHQVSGTDNITSTVAETQSSLNIQRGPLFAADFFEIEGSNQMIFLAAHHLVIDMVSWRIILQDLEESLTTGTVASEKALSFQVWNSMQADNSMKLSESDRNNVLPFDVAPSNMKYWGMDNRPNTYSDVNRGSFTVNEELTELALGESNDALRTEPIDLFLAAIAHSFSRVFLDRRTPTLFNESHGREPWDAKIDLSRTIGWFTSIFPAHVEVDMDEDDVVETVRRMKDNKRKIPYNGRPYFAQRFLNPEGRSKFRDHNGTMEIIFNYLGRMQQLEHDDSLLQQYNYPEDEETSKIISDVGPKASRFALFEISAGVVRDKIEFSFLYNRQMKQQQSIHRWIAECQSTFEEIVERLAEIKEGPIFTLSDFPLLPISYDGLQKIVEKSLPQVGITPDFVEEIYPCAPLQEGLLLAQIKNPSLYHFHAVFEVHPAEDGIKVDAKRLAKAWQKVVDYHAALRTVFADSVYRGDIFNQIVVKSVDSGVMLIQSDDSDALDQLSTMSILDANYKRQPRLPHQATICETSSGKVYFKGEVNHGVIDGSSANIMLRDLAAAYHGRLPEGPRPLYSDYIRFIKSQPSGVGIKFWKSYLEGVRACHFPILNTEPVVERRLCSVSMDFDRYPELQEMCKKMNVTLANVMQAAWAFCLRKYTKSEDVAFGYLTSGRDCPVKNIQATMGAFINMLVCRVKFSKQATLKEIFQKVQNDYLQSLEHQYCSLAQVQHDIMGGSALFNTAVSIQSDGPSDGTEKSSISFDPVAAQDPSEYVATLNVRTVRGDEGCVIRFWNDVLSPGQATELAETMAKVVDNFVSKPHQLVEELDLSKESNAAPDDQIHNPLDRPQVLHSDIQLRAIVSECVREIIEQMFRSGALVSYDQQKINNTINSVNPQVAVAQPMIDYSQMSNPVPTPKPEKQVPTISTDAIKPSSFGKIEKKLLSVWSELLEISEDSIGHDDSFFQLGGDSIIAMQMVGIARDEDLALTVANIFRHPTFADMAAVIRLAEESSAPQEFKDTKEYEEAREMRSQAIQNAMYQRYSLLEAANVDAFLQENICPKVKAFRGGIVDVFPVTDFQALAVTGMLMESKWMLNYFYLDGKGSLDLKRLKTSVSRVVDSFDILRTVFVPYGNRFFQVVLKKVQPSFEVDETDDVTEFTSALQQRDRENGPRLGESYLQFTIARQKNSDSHRIIIRMSHAQYDGVCLPSVLAALQLGYRGQTIPPTAAFSTYVRDAARRTTDDHYVYWKTLLKGSSMTNVVHHPGPNYSRGTDAPTALKRTIQISSLSSENITPATIIKAAWALVLAEVSAQSDIVFGNVISGRNALVKGVESIVGPCVNLVPVRIQFQRHWTVLDLLRHIQDQQVADMPYESLGFREIIKHCTSWPDWTNFSTVCQHQNIERQTNIPLGDNDYTLGAVGSQEDFADLTVLSTPQGGDEIEISLIFTSNSGITRSFADMVFDKLCETSASFSADPTAPLPKPAELSAMQTQTLDAAMATIDPAVTTSLQGLSKEELLVYADILTGAWREILWDKHGQSAKVDLETSFYELGGDIIGLAQVASLLEQEGFKLRVEDLVDHPTMAEQLELLAVCSSQKKEREDAELDDVTVPAEEQVVPPPKKGLRKILGKSKGLAKKIRQRRGRDGEEGPESAHIG